jgi:hypothetical protein
VYTSPLPTSKSASYKNLHGAWASGSGSGFFDFERSDGNPDNLPFDGTTQTLGKASWESGTVPATQTILLHINDSVMCTALEGKATETCFVRPAKAVQAKGLTAAKTASPSFTRSYSWGISKAVDKIEIDTEGGPAVFHYTVSVTHDGGTDGGWKVKGKISVSNPNAAAVSGVNVSDAINDTGASCTVTGGSGATIPAESVVEFPYEGSYSAAPEASSETNTATVQWSTQVLANGSILAGSSTTGSAPVNWSATAPTIIDGSVSVTDTLGGSLGTVSYTEASPTKFEYAHIFSGDPAGTCTTHENTATFTTSTSGTKGSASQSVKVCVAAPPTCSKVYGIRHIGPRGPAGQNLDDNLNTTLVGKQELQFAENGFPRLRLTRLTSAKCVITSTEKTFSGEGKAEFNGKFGYHISFAITITGGHTYLTIIIENKGKEVVFSIVHVQLRVSHERIS